jgi:hypothetical protein
MSLGGKGLRINGLYMFLALPIHPQEALNKQHLVYCVRDMSVGCTLMQRARNIQSGDCAASPKDEQVTLETM